MKQDASEDLRVGFLEKVWKTLIHCKVGPPILHDEACLCHMEGMQKKVYSTTQNEFLCKRDLSKQLHLFTQVCFRVQC